MKKMVERLRDLKEKGRMIITPMFTITYNPYKKVFVLDVPDESKVLKLAIPQTSSIYYWDARGLFPVEVAAENYEMAWQDLQPYTDGATIDMIPSFLNEGDEYIWFLDEEGEIPVRKDEIIEL